MRYFKRWPRFRLFAATFIAAAIGNMILTFYSHQVKFVGKIGLWETLRGFSVCTFYSILLAIGVGISQMRKPQQSPGWLREKLHPRYVYLEFSAFCTFSTMSIEPIRYPSIYDFSLIYLI